MFPEKRVETRESEPAEDATENQVETKERESTDPVTMTTTQSMWAT